MTEGLTCTKFLGNDLPVWWGRSAGPDFSAMRNRGKNRLGLSPPKNLPGVPDWNCVKPIFGPSHLLWLLVLPPHQATRGSWPYGVVISTSGPTLEKRGLRPRQTQRLPCVKGGGPASAGAEGLLAPG